MTSKDQKMSRWVRDLCTWSAGSTVRLVTFVGVRYITTLYVYMLRVLLNVPLFVWDIILKRFFKKESSQERREEREDSKSSPRSRAWRRGGGWGAGGRSGMCEPWGVGEGRSCHISRRNAAKKKKYEPRWNLSSYCISRRQQLMEDRTPLTWNFQKRHICKDRKQIRACLGQWVAVGTDRKWSPGNFLGWWTCSRTRP